MNLPPPLDLSRLAPATTSTARDDTARWLSGRPSTTRGRSACTRSDVSQARLTFYGALYLLCGRWQTGGGSRGARLLDRLCRAGYEPGRRVRHGRFESQAQRCAYQRLWAYRKSL